MTTSVHATENDPRLARSIDLLFQQVYKTDNSIGGLSLEVLADTIVGLEQPVRISIRRLHQIESLLCPIADAVSIVARSIRTMSISYPVRRTVDSKDSNLQFRPTSGVGAAILTTAAVAD